MREGRGSNHVPLLAPMLLRPGTGNPPGRSIAAGEEASMSVFIPIGPMDHVTERLIVTEPRESSDADIFEFTPTRIYHDRDHSLAEAYIGIFIYDYHDHEYYLNLTPQDARALATTLNAWAAACDQERESIGK
jgi:hypothetical protein